MNKLILSAVMITTIMFVTSCCDQKKKETMNNTPAIVLENMDTKTLPGENFFVHVNGKWMSENEIPAEYSQYGAFTEIYEDNQKQLRELVKEVSAIENAQQGSVSQKIRDMYNSGMDTTAIEEAGISPIKPELDEISELTSKPEILKYVSKMHRTGLNPFFYIFAEADQENSSMNIAYIYQGGIGLPDVDYYRTNSDDNIKLREKYVAHITKMFELAGYEKTDADKKAQSVLEIETKLAEVSKTRLERRDPLANFNKMTIDQLQESSSNIDWQSYFNNVGINEPGMINVAQPVFFEGISNVFNDSDTDTLKDYLEWNVIDGYASYLNNDIVEQNFDFFGRTLSGTPELQPRWKRVLNNTSSRLGEAIGQLYVKRYFPPEAKERMLVLVENLRLAFADRITQLDWMSDETKEKALQKLELIKVKIGYPDEWKDYSNLEIVADSYVQNVKNSREFEFNYNIAKVNKPVNDKEWGMTPQTVNAYYNPSKNEIVFPAGILQPPFFNMNADDAVNYGAIGVVIGHEMTHGFDDQGRKFDKNGNLNDWWTEEDSKKFEEKTKLLIEQYNNYKILDTLNVDGKLTLGENIADLGGLNIAYEALQKAYDGNTPAPVDDLTSDQRFFVGYAQVWRQNIRDKELIKRLKIDVHSPGDARVNIPPFNMDVFVKAFNISEDDALFIPEAGRAYIW